MSLGFLDPMRVVPDHRIQGMVTYPLDEVLLARLVGGICGADDWEGVEEVAGGAVGLAARVSAVRRGDPDGAGFAQGVPVAPQALQQGFAAWAASLRAAAREVIAVDGKTLRGSKTSPDGTGALHLVSA